MQALLHPDEALALLGREFRYRHAGELGDDLGDVLGPDLRRARAAGTPPSLRGLLQLLALGIMLSLQVLAAVELLSGRRIILLALKLAHLRFQLLHVDGPRRRRNLHPRRRLVDEVDGLVGQEAARDVAVRQLGSGDDRLVGDRDLVVRLEGVAKAAQDHDGLRHRRLRHEDRLEAPLQRRILLDVLLVFVEGRGADQVQLAAGEGRLEHVGDVEAAFAAALAGADNGVDLVDEQDEAVLHLRRPP